MPNCIDPRKQGGDEKSKKLSPEQTKLSLILEKEFK
jgi:hypothetical protein